VHLPALVCRKFASSRIVAFSTGNVYGLVPAAGSGSVETDSLAPVGEYAMSCLGRERIFEHFSRTLGTRVVLVRTRGLWGSRFSRAQGRPDFGKVLIGELWDLAVDDLTELVAFLRSPAASRKPLVKKTS